MVSPDSASSSSIRPIRGSSASRRSPTVIAVRSWRRAAISQPVFVAAVEEVGEQEAHHPAPRHPPEVFEGAVEVGAAALGAEGEDLADHPPDVAPPLLRRDEQLDAVGEDHQPDPVVALDGGVGEHRRHLRGHFVLELGAAAERARRRDVDQQHHGQLALLAVLLDVGEAGAGGDVPVDRADVVARLVLAHLLELHAAPLEGALVLAGEDVGDQPLGADLDRLDLLEQLRRQRLAEVDGGGSAGSLEHRLAEPPRSTGEGAPLSPLEGGRGVGGVRG